MKFVRPAFWLIVLLTTTSCQNMRASQAPPWAGRVHHVVVCWLNEPGNADHRRQVMEASRKLTEIPGVLSVSAGTVLPDDRPNVDSSFDVALVMTLKDEASLRAYPSHPIHQQILQETIRPLVAKFVAYDFIDGK
jgi:hypothetical protein